jgi:hypothetical protein
MGASEGSSPSRARVAIVAVSAALLFAIIAAGFWYEDLRYALPTPRPAALSQPPRGTAIPVRQWLRPVGLDAGERPVLVHFFNPDCPCSRFNLEHLSQLRATFGDRVLFVAAIQNEAADDEIDAKVRELDLGIPHFADRGGKRAGEAGVYSTPQAVLVDAEDRLVYRGNYNTSRFCTDPRTEFVRLALEGLVGESRAPLPKEFPAYGCELPANQLFASQTN